MSDSAPAPFPGQVSPDGQYVWNGTSWMPNPNLPKPKKRHTARNVILGVLGLMLLLIVGCVALIGGAADEVDKAITEENNKPGGTDNPLEITEGQAFEVDGFDYAKGWKITEDPLDQVQISGLKITNNRDSKDAADVEIKFWKGNEVLATTDCSTSVIAVGTTARVDCVGGDKLPKAYDRVTINDVF